MTRPLAGRRNADAAVAALSLDRTSAVGLHAQLGLQLRQLILAARIAPGTRLPSSRTLSEELQVSRATVVLAYDQLASEGYVEGRRGAGVFVSPSLPEQSLQVARPARPARPGLDRRAERSHGEPIRPFMGAADPSLFPHQHWARLLHRIWRHPDAALTARIDPFGWPELRDAIARHLGEWRGIACHGDQIIITSGAVEAAELIARCAFEAGDSVYVEEPGYQTLRFALTLAGLKPCPVPVDGEGFDLERALRQPEARGAILTPSRQFPLGVVLPLHRRLALLEWAASVGGYIVEDDFDSEYRYEGSPLPALMSLDRAGRAIYIGSFSKVLSPALRLGFVVVPDRVVGAFRDYLRRRGSMASLVCQPALAELMREGAYATHIRRTRRIYARRLASLLRQGQRLAGLLELSPSSAGMHVVADFTPALAGRLSDREAARLAREAGLTTSPLADYYALRPQRRGLLLGFAGFSEEVCAAAVARLATALAANSTSE